MDSNRTMIAFLMTLTSLYLIFSFVTEKSVAADGEKKPLVSSTVFGIVAHDRGFLADEHEGGVDPNWEIQFSPPTWKFWRWLGSPQFMAGLTPNFNGDTSAFYGGLMYEFSLSNRLTDKLTYNLTKHLFIAGSLSAAVHTGPLHKNQNNCRNHSDCGFGYRVLPRIAGEIGVKFWKNQAVSLFWDHMSHKGLGDAQNEGIDHVGMRYHFYFDKF